VIRKRRRADGSERHDSMLHYALEGYMCSYAVYCVSVGEGTLGAASRLSLVTRFLIKA
jgi:hypothetical protein